MTRIKVLAVASEIYPLVKTGGLADVVGALPRALRKHGVETVTLVPGYPAVKAAFGKADEVFAVDDLFGGRARVLAAKVGDLDLFVLDAPHLFGRQGNPYVTDDGRDWPDNAFRFGALGWIAAHIGIHPVAGFAPDILHGHDWQAGLAMAYLAYGGDRRPATVFTAHNLAYQGQFPADLLGRLHLPPHAYAIDGVEHYGAIGFLKAGLQLADRITTVSPTYAKEIQTAACGCGLEGLLRARSGVLSGIRNGIDVDVWNPETDTRIAARFGPVRRGDTGEKENEHRGPYGPAVTLVLHHSAERVSQPGGDDEDDDHRQEVRPRRGILERVGSIGVEKATAVGADLLDRFLTGDRPHRDRLLHALEGGDSQI